MFLEKGMLVEFGIDHQWRLSCVLNPEEIWFPIMCVGEKRVSTRGKIIFYSEAPKIKFRSNIRSSIYLKTLYLNFNGKTLV